MRKIFWLMLTFLATRTHAQVSMAAQLPPEGILMKSQLWNIMVVSADNKPSGVRISLRVIDAVTNEPVFTGMSRSIMLQKGARQLKLEDVMPVAYEYLSPAIDRSPTGMLPAGNYLACYQLLAEDVKKGLVPAEECLPFVISPLSPPLLNAPANETTTPGPQPQFSWMPPMPAHIFNDLNYEMLLTELRDGQSPAEAVQFNLPVFRVLRLKVPYVNYPSGGTKLDTAKTYAWTVFARNGNQFAAQTEVWTFRPGNAGLAENLSAGAYVLLKPSPGGTVAAMGDRLLFAYENAAGKSKVNYEITDLANGNVRVQQGTLELAPGVNQLDIPLRRHVGSGGTYLLRLTKESDMLGQLMFTRKTR